MLSESEFWSQHRVAEGGCWLWTGRLDGDGYGLVDVDAGFPARAHRKAWEFRFGPIPTGKNVLHKCDHPACIRPSHLYLGTTVQNVMDMVNRGRVRSKLKTADIIAIRKDPRSKSAIAEHYGVSLTTIISIINRKTWAHVKDEQEPVPAPQYAPFSASRMSMKFID